MSRTDHHNPDHVRAHHAHLDGLRTDEDHSWFCELYVSPWGHIGPQLYSIRDVERQLAEASGWYITWESHSRSARVYARVPRRPHACDIDLVHGLCTREIEDRDHQPTTGAPGKADRHTYYFDRERAEVRDALRVAAKEYRGAGDVDTEAPTRQHRHGRWNGGWWD